jgi:hypothetical protein
MGTYSSLGTLLKLSIASVFTTVAGVRDVDFETPELELMDVDDLSSDYVDRDMTGRSAGGSVKGSMFYDPASASNTALIALYNSPTVTSGVRIASSWQIVWSASPAATQAFTGVLTKQNTKAERGSPLLKDLDIAVTRKPTLV